MANHAVMTYHRNLSFDIVSSFYKPYLSLIGPSMRRMMFLTEQGYIMHEKSSVTEEDGMGTFHWVIWLLDRLEQHDKPNEFKPHSTRRIGSPDHASFSMSGTALSSSSFKRIASSTSSSV